MSARFICHVIFLLLLLITRSVQAAGIDDADQRLFQAQQSLANKGDARAQYYFGEMFEQGLGTAQNIDEAFKWYAKAAEQGDALAKRKLAHRSEIEADAKAEQAAGAIKAAPETPKTPGTPRHKAQTAGKIKSSSATARTDKSAIEEAKIKAAHQAAEKEKRRAAVRAMLRERMLHPVGEPFE